MRERGAERQRGPGQLRMWSATIREKWHAPGHVLQTLFPLLCGPTITLRVSRPLFQLSGDSGGSFLGVIKWNLSLLSLFLFFLFKNSAPAAGAKQRNRQIACPLPLQSTASTGDDDVDAI